MGLDDGCSEDREHEISRKCGVKVSLIDFNILIAKHAHKRSLTSLDGDPVGTSFGFRGAFEGD